MEEVRTSARAWPGPRTDAAPGTSVPGRPHLALFDRAGHGRRIGAREAHIVGDFLALGRAAVHAVVDGDLQQAAQILAVHVAAPRPLLRRTGPLSLLLVGDERAETCPAATAGSRPGTKGIN